jgi:hypothetical protein
LRIANRPTDVFKYIDMSGGPDACWPFTGKVNNKGRPYFAVAGTKHLVYRLVYELVNGVGSLKDRIARHTCDNEICCNPNHIVPGDHQQNMDDMKERERHGLPHHTIRAIRKLGEVGVSHKSIGDRFGIGRSTVTEIVNRTNYAHVKDEEDAKMGKG